MGRPSNNVPSCGVAEKTSLERKRRRGGEKISRLVLVPPHWCWLQPRRTAGPSGWCWWGQQGEPEHHWCWTGWCDSLYRTWTLSGRTLQRGGREGGRGQERRYFEQRNVTTYFISQEIIFPSYTFPWFIKRAHVLFSSLLRLFRASLTPDMSSIHQHVSFWGKRERLYYFNSRCWHFTELLVTKLRKPWGASELHFLSFKYFYVQIEDNSNKTKKITKTVLCQSEKVK